MIMTLIAIMTMIANRTLDTPNTNDAVNNNDKKNSTNNDYNNRNYVGFYDNWVIGIIEVSEVWVWFALTVHCIITKSLAHPCSGECTCNNK